ncbi:type VII secretion target [Pseudonocardia sp. HH130630-07]|uniref:type VII secretion target n=1 Tax=Pseudonocardia sp. HH130630-07 TaxID=1690815 RepID=UPI000814E999|nr:type VII secretion target [Pseudonocardia sp. HH130630-07]ANY06872.1 hypothetical protein AFB00_11870 [Pseudonocardia sp. HH130630-07]
MTAPGFWVVPDHVDEHARQVEELATAVAESGPDRADISPDAYGLIGAVFAQAVCQPMAACVVELGNRADALRDLGDTLRTTTAAYRETEERNTAYFMGMMSSSSLSSFGLGRA